MKTEKKLTDKTKHLRMLTMRFAALITMMNLLISLGIGLPQQVTEQRRIPDRKPLPVLKTKLLGRTYSGGDLNPSLPFEKTVHVNARVKIFFQWSTTEQGVTLAKWQVTDLQGGFPAGEVATPANIIAQGQVQEIPPAGQTREFEINFKYLLSQTPPNTPKHYYVRMIPLKGEQKLAPSSSVKITYTKPDEPTKFEETNVRPNRPGRPGTGRRITSTHSPIKQLEVSKTSEDPIKFNRRLIISMTQKSAYQLSEVEVKGNFREGYKYHIWFYYQADRTYRFPIIITKKGDDYLKGNLPQHAKLGGYDVYVTGGDTRRDSPTFGASEKSNTLNFTVHEKPLDTYQFDIAFIGFECFEESADGPGSDEIYMAAIGLNHGYETVAASRVHEGVNQNHFRDEIVPLGRLDRFKILVVGLGEFDSDGSMDFNHHTLRSWPRGRAAAGWSNIVGTYPQKPMPITEANLKTQAERVAFYKVALARGITGYSDDCLGVEELAFTDDELRKAILLNGKPFEKSLHYRGDTSHYRAVFHLKVVKPDMD
jgi:hypothetical protein